MFKLTDPVKFFNPSLQHEADLKSKKAQIEKKWDISNQKLGEARSTHEKTKLEMDNLTKEFTALKKLKTSLSTSAEIKLERDMAAADSNRFGGGTLMDLYETEKKSN